MIHLNHQAYSAFQQYSFCIHYPLFSYVHPPVPVFLERLFVFNIHHSFLWRNTFHKHLFEFHFVLYLLYDKQRAIFSTETQLSSMLDTFYYLYGESYRSEILTFKTLAIFSRLSSVGEYFSIIILLRVDFVIPVICDSCRTDTFFSYMICVSSIFIKLLFAKIIYLFCFYSRK